jgi:pyruvate kinase
MVQCKNDFTVGDKMKMHLPGALIAADTMTERDIDDVTEFGLKNSTQIIDFVSASFVRKASDVELIRGILGANGQNVKIIAKIQNHEGLHNYDEILAEADGIMISRGDLALEIPSWKVFIAQKWMIEKANLAGKPVMIANQMLESMVKSARPTRAEASDVANAILDGVDCVVLGDETASGDYPINAVSILAKCCVEAEKTIDYKKVFNDLRLYSPAPYGTAESVAQAAVSSVLDLKIDQIVVVTETGKLARLVAKYKPEVGIFACSTQDFVVR